MSSVMQSTMPSRLSSVTPETTRRFHVLFLLAGLYDLVLGLAFLLTLEPLFTWLAVPLPENPTYAHLAAGLVAVQGVGYLFVWRHLWRNVDLVKMGCIYKLVYIGVAIAAYLQGNLPHPLFGWLAVADALFLIGFVIFLRTAVDVRNQAESSRRAGMALDPSLHWVRDA
jgi:uncharacterized membrane protein YfcA